MDELKKHKQEEEEAKNRAIEKAVGAIFKDPKKSVTIGQIAKDASCHRNTVSQRVWELSRPLTLGEKFFPAGKTVHIDNLCDAIKEHRASKAARRTKKQLDQAETLTEDVADLNDQLAVMQEENAQLFLEMEEMRETQAVKNRSHELYVESLKGDKELADKRTASHLEALSKMRKERDQWKAKAEELEQELQKLRPSTGKKASLTVLKPQTDKD